MADILTQFHALPEELLQFVKECVAEFKLHVVAMRFFPFDAIEINPDELEAVFSNSSPYEEIALTLRPPSLPVKSNTSFYDKNPDLLRVDIRRRVEKGLRQTGMVARTDDPDALAIWRKIVRRLKGITMTGLVAFDPVTGATAPMRSFRFTTGAKELEASGVPLLPFAGGCVLKLGTVCQPARKKTKLRRKR